MSTLAFRSKRLAALGIVTVAGVAGAACSSSDSELRSSPAPDSSSASTSEPTPSEPTPPEPVTSDDSVSVPPSSSSTTADSAPTSEPVSVPTGGSDDASLTSIAGDVSIGVLPVATYFSFDRYADGAGIEWVGDNDEDFATFLAERPETLLLGEPFGSAFKLQQTEAVLVDLADVDASYDTGIGGGDGSLLVGDFDPDVVAERPLRSRRRGSSQRRGWSVARVMSPRIGI